VPKVVARRAYGLYAAPPAITDYQVFDGRGHSLAFDSGWNDVAGYVLRWVIEHDPAADQASRTTAVSGSTALASRPEWRRRHPGVPGGVRHDRRLKR
jgi:hypothetical protein